VLKWIGLCRTTALLSGKEYTRLIEPEYQWSTWAAPKLEDGKIDHNAQTGDDLLDFVNNELFPYLKKFKDKAASADTIEYKIGEIFSELKNRIQSGYNLREVVALIDQLRFRTHADQLEMSHLYEGKIKNMGRGCGVSRFFGRGFWLFKKFESFIHSGYWDPSEKYFLWKRKKITRIYYWYYEYDTSLSRSS